MKRSSWLISAGAVLLVGALVIALRAKQFPLGVRGEWEWARLPVAPTTLDLMRGGACLTIFAVFAGIGRWVLATRRPPLWREALAVGILVVAAILVQLFAQESAPYGYGLAKWVVALAEMGSNGYFTVARDEVSDPRRFLAEYPAWIQGQDALHIGTHPPGLIMTQWAILSAMKSHPGLADALLSSIPDSVSEAFRVLGAANPKPPAERATLSLTGILTLLACASVVAPLYILARASLEPADAWAAATLWPLAPSAILFQPTADSAFALLSTTALALSAHSTRLEMVWGRVLALICGIVLGVGTQFSLVFLPVGLVVAISTVMSRSMSPRRSLVLILSIGAGFLATTCSFWLLTGANPFAVWWWNQRNHARFYEEFPRSYGKWLVANPIELAVALGLPASLWLVVAFRRPGDVPRTSVATLAVLAALTVSGRNLSEVARLWLPFMPALLVASGFALGKAGGGAKTLALAVALGGLETIALQAMIQVVYPF